MKRIIDGRAYNTATAIEVFSEEECYGSGAWWGLYQTRFGEFFKVKFDHGGEEVLEFGPIADTEAQELLEEHANHLVEQYFGEMPEGGMAERRLTIRLPGNLVERMEVSATCLGLSLNSYAMRCFEQCVSKDGFPPMRA
ncbi:MULTISPECIES: hypothetical protein [Chromobacterium]|uniref:Toxin-antitoxin system HicB family antitoxin n=1 Tax=Chromobacterium aquaticum TaxID=467180 RepID=A0ABV9A213_9NEIS|nr:MULTISPECIES: hypothetical protein [Chromobacterium]MCD5360512.1 hypothetical protein [Chromobacterium aquaticum]